MGYFLNTAQKHHWQKFSTIIKYDSTFLPIPTIKYYH